LQNGPDPAGLENWNHDREKFKLGIKDFLLETESDSDGWQLQIRPQKVRLTANAGPPHRESRIMIRYHYSRLATHQSRTVDKSGPDPIVTKFF
jgi:hypothetical protein